MLNRGQTIGQNGHLFIGGCDTVLLAEQYGTPLYVMDEDVIRSACRGYTDAYKCNGVSGYPCYASKAFSCLEMCRIARQERLGLDVVSGGELFTALNSGFPEDRIVFHGNNKTPQEIRMALRYGVGRIVVDNLDELELINRIATELSKKANIALRIKPGIEAHTHEYIKTGQIDSKFGFALCNNEAINAVKKCIEYDTVNLCQLHCHIGSQIFDTEPFVDSAYIMLDFIADIKQTCGLVIDELALGGGFGIRYVDSDTPKTIAACIKAINDAVTQRAKAQAIQCPKVFLEPGRSIVGEAGATLYTVGSVKEIKGIRTYVSVDGGMTDNIRYPLYKAKYTVINACKADSDNNTVVTVAGRCCESGDLIQENVKLPQTEPGDILAVLSTGAYNYSMASNYNRVCRPAVVMVSNGESRIVVQRETYSDIIRNDV